MALFKDRVTQFALCTTVVVDVYSMHHACLLSYDWKSIHSRCPGAPPYVLAGVLLNQQQSLYWRKLLTKYVKRYNL